MVRSFAPGTCIRAGPFEVGTSINGPPGGIARGGGVGRGGAGRSGARAGGLGGRAAGGVGGRLGGAPGGGDGARGAPPPKTDRTACPRPRRNPPSDATALYPPSPAIQTTRPHRRRSAHQWARPSRG